MEFIRWVILSWEEPLFEGRLVVPFGFMTIFITGFAFVMNVIFGAIVLTIALSFWGLVGYVFISREVKEFYKRYEEEKARGSKTPK